MGLRAIALLVGLSIGMLVVSMAGTWAREDVLPAVIAVGIALPLGWSGLGALRRR